MSRHRPGRHLAPTEYPPTVDDPSPEHLWRIGALANAMQYLLAEGTVPTPANVALISGLTHRGVARDWATAWHRVEQRRRQSALDLTTPD